MCTFPVVVFVMAGCFAFGHANPLPIPELSTDPTLSHAAPVVPQTVATLGAAVANAQAAVQAAQTSTSPEFRESGNSGAAVVPATPTSPATTPTSATTIAPAWLDATVDDSDIAGVKPPVGAVMETARQSNMWSSTGTGHYWTPVRSPVACDAWLTSGVVVDNEKTLTHLPKKGHMCYTVTGWVKQPEIESKSAMCSSWYINDAYQYVPSEERPDKGDVSAANYQGLSTIVRKHANIPRPGYLSYILSYNDVAGRTDLDNPARTAARVKAFEECFVYPWCAAMPSLGKDDRYKYQSDGFSQGGTDSGQDRWVIENFNFKKGGTYIDIGASDGIEMSNTYLLDKCYGWTGLAIDANDRRFLGLSRSNRGGETLFGCVGDKNTVAEFQTAGGLSALRSVESQDHAERIKQEEITTEKYKVPCYDFGALLQRWYKYRGITSVDYMTIDIEGAEHLALSSIDFQKTPIKVIGVEIHFESADNVASLLESKGYERMQHGDVSDTFFKLKGAVLG